jgi:hypothetical protein
LNDGSEYDFFHAISSVPQARFRVTSGKAPSNRCSDGELQCAGRKMDDRVFCDSAM